MVDVLYDFCSVGSYKQDVLFVYWEAQKTLRTLDCQHSLVTLTNCNICLAKATVLV